MRRKVVEELLDRDLGTADEIAASLDDLRRINIFFGGRRTAVTLLRQVFRESGLRELTLLEVGAATGDIPDTARRLLGREGMELRVTLLDRMWSHINGSHRSAVCGDALHLPFRDNAFDIVSCSLLAHHLEPDELRRFAAESLRICRRAFLINDLIRSRLHLWLAYAGLPLFRSRITRHDAPASVRRAYTSREMREMLGELPTKELTISCHYLYRMGVLLWKP
jgi:ubiquinone/menaquinone biosynthesis C-methylase UbiE